MVLLLLLLMSEIIFVGAIADDVSVDFNVDAVVFVHVDVVVCANCCSWSR